MPDDAIGNRSKSQSHSRRGFLKRVGVGGSALSATFLAGCSSLTGGDSGGRRTISLTSFPQHTDGVIHDYMEREGVLEEKFDEAGYDVEMQNPVQDISLFLSEGEIDQVNMGTLEAARLVAEQDVNLAIAGRINSIFYGTYVRSDSDLTLDETGSVEATWNKVADEDRRIAIISWGIGNIPGEQTLLQTEYDLQLQEGGGDFSNVVVVDAAAIPTLLANGDIDVGLMAPSFSPPGPLANGEIEPLYTLSDKMINEGFGIPHLDGPVFRQSTIEDHPEAAEAYVDALTEAQNWFYETGYEEVPGDEDLRGNLNSPDQDIAEYQCNWLTAWNTGEEMEFAPENPTLYNGAHLNEDWIQQNKKYVNNAGDRGLISDNWSEDMWGDKIEYVTF